MAEVITTAKRNLKPGDKLGDFGGNTFYGQIDWAETAAALGALPVGSVPGVLVINPVAAREIIS